MQPVPVHNTSIIMRKFFTETVWSFIGDIIRGLAGSLNNKREDGYSARKLTALASMLLISYCVFNYVDETNVIQALIVLCIFVLILLGLIVIENLVELVKSIKGNNNDSKSSGT